MAAIDQINGRFGRGASRFPVASPTAMEDKLPQAVASIAACLREVSRVKRTPIFFFKTYRYLPSGNLSTTFSCIGIRISLFALYDLRPASGCV